MGSDGASGECLLAEYSPDNQEPRQMALMRLPGRPPAPVLDMRCVALLHRLGSSRIHAPGFRWRDVAKCCIVIFGGRRGRSRQRGDFRRNRSRGKLRARLADPSFSRTPWLLKSPSPSPRESMLTARCNMQVDFPAEIS